MDWATFAGIVTAVITVLGFVYAMLQSFRSDMQLLIQGVKDEVRELKDDFKEIKGDIKEIKQDIRRLDQKIAEMDKQIAVLNVNVLYIDNGPMSRHGIHSHDNRVANNIPSSSL